MLIRVEHENSFITSGSGLYVSVIRVNTVSVDLQSRINLYRRNQLLPDANAIG